jgi:protein disulfide-isomerase
MRTLPASLLLGLLLATAACHKQDSANGPAPVADAQQIAWREGDVDDAFAEARESGKPVLLYWGAKWCPPCNQLKSTLFKDPGFIAETRDFIPVHLDGDSKNAQMWGERFGISGYPTVIILRPDRSEVTRLSSASGAGNLAALLKSAAGRTMSFDQLLAKASHDPKTLTADDWTLLADFDWGNDPKRFKDSAKSAAILGTLAQAAPSPALQHRFALLALTTAITPDDDGRAKLSPAQQAQVTTLMPAILADPAQTRANHQELTYAAPMIIAALPDAGQRRTLGAALIAATDRMQADTSLPLRDRLDTVRADIALGKTGTGADTHVPPAVLAKVSQRVQWADGEAKDPMTRQSLIASAGEMLDEAGDRAGGMKLMEAELPRSVAPYYYMLDLSGMAEEAKQPKVAVEWARKAAETAQGPATRVQWAVEYSKAVMRLTPDDKPAVEKSAGMVIAALGDSPGDYYQRTQHKVADWTAKLRDWSKAHGGSDVLQRLDGQLAQMCDRQGAQQASCKASIAAA